MRKQDIIRELKKYKLDTTKYIVISGAAMVLYGIKEETPDIDISVTTEYEQELLSKYNAILEHIGKNDNNAYMIDDIINFGVNYYSKANNYIEGLPVQSIDEIIELKKKLNRPKDKKDLQLLSNFLK